VGALGQVSTRSRGRTLAVTACLYCGKSLSLLQRWLGADRHFCSIPHRDLYKQEQTRLAIKALEWNGRFRAQPVPSPLAKKAKPVLVSKPNSSVANNFRYERVLISKHRAIALPSQRRVIELPCPFSRSRLAGGSGAIAPLLCVEFRNPRLALAEPIHLSITCSAALPFSRRGAILPVVFRQQLVILPELKFEDALEELVPASAPAFAVALEMTRRTGASKPRELWRVTPLVASSIQPLGVDDPDESSATRRRAKALASIPPRVVGDALKCSFMPAAQAGSIQRLGLRAARQPEQGLFIPGLRLGTLRPRVAFGPKPVTYAERDGNPAATQKRPTPPVVGPTIVAKQGSVR
jgi:hypothetical protein